MGWNPVRAMVDPTYTFKDNNATTWLALGGDPTLNAAYAEYKDKREEARDEQRVAVAVGEAEAAANAAALASSYPNTEEEMLKDQYAFYKQHYAALEAQTIREALAGRPMDLVALEARQTSAKQAGLDAASRNIAMSRFGRTGVLTPTQERSDKLSRVAGIVQTTNVGVRGGIAAQDQQLQALSQLGMGIAPAAIEGVAYGEYQAATSAMQRKMASQNIRMMAGGAVAGGTGAVARGLQGYYENQTPNTPSLSNRSMWNNQVTTPDTGYDRATVRYASLS